MESKVKDSTIEILQRDLSIFKENSRKLRAVLRVPRLSTEYHNLIKQDHMPELKVLDGVYEKHYEIMAQEMGQNG